MRFDINCKTDKGVRINVEMSFRREPFAPVRLEYHAARLFTGQDIRGIDKKFTDLKETYQITILAFIRLFNDDELFHKFEYFDQANQIPLGGRSRIITLELIKLDKIVKRNIIEMNAIEHWAYFFRYLTDKSRRSQINEILMCEEGIAMAGEVLMTITKDEIEQAIYESNLRYELDRQNDMAEAKCEEREKWQGVVADKDAEIARLREQLKINGISDV